MKRIISFVSAMSLTATLFLSALPVYAEDAVSVTNSSTCICEDVCDSNSANDDCGVCSQNVSFCSGTESSNGETPETAEEPMVGITLAEQELLPNSDVTIEATDNVVTTTEQFEQAMLEKRQEITVSGEFTVSKEYVVDYPLVINAQNSATIKFNPTSARTLFTVKENGRLTLGDSQGELTLHGNARESFTFTAVAVEANGVFSAEHVKFSKWSRSIDNAGVANISSSEIYGNIGRGISAVRNKGSLTMQATVVRDNECRGILHEGNSMTLTNCIIANNKIGKLINSYSHQQDEKSGYGAGLLLFKAATLENCTIEGNKGIQGGGLATINVGVGSDNGDIVTLKNCTVQNNDATGLTASKNAGNTPAVEFPIAGGLLFSNSHVTIEGGKISGNHAGIGGGVYALSSNVGLSKVLLDGNRADYAGGGIYGLHMATPGVELIENAGKFEVNSCIITNNAVNGPYTTVDKAITACAQELYDAFKDDFGAPFDNLDAWKGVVLRSSLMYDIGGAGIFQQGIDSTIVDTEISGNSSIYRGGGIYNASVDFKDIGLSYDNGSCVLNGKTVLQNNSSKAQEGRAIYVDKDVKINSSASIQGDCHIAKDVEANLILMDSFADHDVIEITTPWAAYKGWQVVKAADNSVAQEELASFTSAGQKSWILHLCDVNDNLPTKAESIVLWTDEQSSKYTLFYDANGGVGGPQKPEEHIANEKITITNEEPTRNSYQFLSWDTKKDGGGNSYAFGDTFNMPSEDLVLYAQWKHMVHVNFDPNGATGEMSPIETEENTTVTLPDQCDFRHPGKEGIPADQWSFVGWTKEPNTKPTIDSVAVEEHDVTVYAYWQNTFKVFYDANGGTGTPIECTELSPGDSKDVKDCTYTKEGYTFYEWNTKPDGSGNTYHPDIEINSRLRYDNFNTNVTLYAQWVPEKLVTVKYDLNGGEPAEGSPADLYADKTYPRTKVEYVIPSSDLDLEPKPVNDGYIFDKWLWRYEDEPEDSWKTLSSYNVPRVGNYNATNHDVIILRAEWQASRVTFHYDTAGGSPIEEVTVFDYNDPKLTDFVQHMDKYIGENLHVLFYPTEDPIYPGQTFATWTISFAELSGLDNNSNEYKRYTELLNKVLNGDLVEGSPDWDEWEKLSRVFSRVPMFETLVGQSKEDFAKIAFESIQEKYPDVTLEWCEGYGYFICFEALATEAMDENVSDVTIMARYKDSDGNLLYNVSYDPNGVAAQNIPDNALYKSGDIVTVADLVPTATGKKFVGWNTQPDGKGIMYEAKDTFTMPSVDMTLYAQWETAVTITPASITVYMGGSGYEGTVNEKGVSISGNEIVASYGFPEPGFTVNLPDELSGADMGKLLLQYLDEDGNVHWQWKLEQYGEGNGNVYRITPYGGTETRPVRMQFTDKAGNSIEGLEAFDFNKYLNQSLQMKVYGQGVEEEKVRLFYEGNVYPIDIGVDATVTVRGTTASVSYGEVEEDPHDDYAPMDPESEKALPGASVAAGTVFTINGSNVQVGTDAEVGLLFDRIIESNASSNGKNYTQLLEHKAEVALGDTPVTEGKVRVYESRYLDLVDQNNGNAWVAAQDTKGTAQDVTVYWPLPEGTDKNTHFTLLHFNGLHRSLTPEQITQKLTDATYTPEVVKNLRVTDTHVVFETTGFSPFVLTWETEKSTPVPNPGKEDENSSNNNNDGNTTNNKAATNVSVAPAATEVAIPQTGDYSHPLMWVAVMLICALFSCGLLYRMLKRRNKE